MSMQTSIFNHDVQDVEFAVLCNALYEQQLDSLSNSQLPPSLLRSRLKGLSHHVKRAAEYMLQSDGPLILDIHNGTWQFKQTQKRPQSRYTPEQTEQWFVKHAAHGLVIPVPVSEIGEEFLELDNIDRIDTQHHTFHLNKHGWFNFNGSPHNDDGQRTAITRPFKAQMLSASCGHRWNHKGKNMPRRLSMRELLLSLSINWQNFTLAQKE